MRKDPDVQVKVSARHGHIDDAMKEQVAEKAGKLLHYFDRVLLIEVTLDLRGEQKTAEVLVNAEHKHDFVAQGAAADPLIAVNIAIDRMKVQLTHYKEKLQDHRRDAPAGGPEIKKG